MTQKIAVIKAGWSQEIVASAEKSFRENMQKQGFPPQSIDVFEVPGSLEIPLAGKKLLEEGGYDIAVGMGFVVNGGIYRHEFVAQAVVDGIVNVGLQTGKPFLSVVLTPISFNEHSEENQKFFIDHMVIKGEEAANACIKMLDFTAGETKKAA